MAGPLKVLACAWESPIDVEEGVRTPLAERLLSFIPVKYSEFSWPEEVCRIYHDAALELGYAFACAEILGTRFNTWDALRVWPMGLSIDYMHLLNNGHPGALVIFAHFCVLLKKLEGKWYFEGRATRLLGHILQRLDRKWQCYIEWPAEEIGFPMESV